MGINKKETSNKTQKEAGKIIDNQKEATKKADNQKEEGKKIDNQKEAAKNNDNTGKNQKENVYDGGEDYEYQNTPNFKYELDINDTKNNGGINCFEVFRSHEDNKIYIVSLDTININIFCLNDNKKIKTLQQIKAHLTMIKYFINKKNFNEYLVSGDGKGVIYIYEINNNYNIKLTFELDDSGQVTPILACLLIFPHNNDNNYLVGAVNTGNIYPERNSTTAIFSFESGDSIRVINNSKKEGIYNLLEWYNKKNNKYYIIQFTSKKILINSLLEEELYCTFINDKKFTYPFPMPYDYHCGVLLNKDETEYLYSSCFNGDISVYDLYNKNLVRTINNDIPGSTINMMIKWNKKYIIANDFMKSSFKIIDIEQNKFMKEISDEHNNMDMVIQKIKHPIYGEALLSSGKESIIKLWTIIK